LVPIPELRSGQLRYLGSEAGQRHPASAPVLAPGSALGVLLSRALSSVQASGDCRCALARRQSPVEVVSFGQTRQRPVMRSYRAHLRSLPTWFLAETK
jgi:hypothetical protein